MTPAIQTTPSPARHLEYEVKFPDNLPFDNNENMDTPWHRAQIELLIHVLETNWKGRRFFCGGNMFIHFSEKRARNRDFRGPDFFVVLDVDHDRPRKFWAIWEEDGRYPDAILELLSPTTAAEDLTTKKNVYERTFGTHEYYCYDPADQDLRGWRLANRYRAITAESGRMWSERLELWIGAWHGTWDGHEDVWLRFFDRDGRMLPTDGEMQAAQSQAETARADTAEAELAKTRKELEALRMQAAKPTP